jgi:vacuolar-type H+-ATPase subunit H
LPYCCTKKVAVAVEEVVETVEEPVEEVIEIVEEVVEEMGDIAGEVLATTTAPAPPTSEKVLKETEKAIAEVKAKGVQETKAKMSFNESVLNPPTPPESVKEEKKEVAKTEKSPGTRKQIAQGVTLIVAAVGVALARNVIKAWLGRGIF